MTGLTNTGVQTLRSGRKPRLAEPKKPEFNATKQCWVYKDREFHASQHDPNSGADGSELAYLRDLVPYYQQQLRGYESWERSVNEALNSGDGSYRP